MEIDKTGLDNRYFEGFVETSDRNYYYLKNLRTGVSRWDKKLLELFDLSSEYMNDGSKKWINLVHPEDKERFLEDVNNIYDKSKKMHSFDFRVKNRQGNYVLCTGRGIILDGEDGADDLMLVSIVNHGLKDNIDSTTNLYNIYEFKEDIQFYKINDMSVILLMIGINNFSEINDVYGYSYGDKVLSAFGAGLRSLLRRYGKRTYRMDGVRFCTCIEDKSKKFIEEVYDEIKKMAREDIYVEGVNIAVTVSAGAAIYSNEYDENSVIASARYAFDKSKHEKHGELVFFDNDLYIDNKRNLEIVNALRRSIIDDYKGFYICYQPIVDAKNERLVGAEALLRWRDDKIGEVPPGVFIPWLETDPSFFELGNWIL